MMIFVAVVARITPHKLVDHSAHSAARIPAVLGRHSIDAVKRSRLAGTGATDASPLWLGWALWDWKRLWSGERVASRSHSVRRRSHFHVVLRITVVEYCKLLMRTMHVPME